MLSSFEKGIITLINNALKGEKNPLPEDFDCSRLHDFSVSQKIIPLIYYGAKNDSRFLSCDAANKLKYATFYSAAISDLQMKEAELIFAEFDKHDLDYMGLKGVGMKKLYPSSDMRMMGDIDILVRDEQQDNIDEVMQSLGYSFQLESDHERIWNKGKVHLELHKRIVPSYNRDFYAYFGNGWKLAKKKDDRSCEYIMSTEDEFVFLFTHFAKHYRDAGIGIRHATDIYVFMESHKDMDMEYVKRAFEKLGIYRFFVNVRNMLNVWFNGADCDEISGFLTNKFFVSGAYGTQKNSIMSQALIHSKGSDVDDVRRKKLGMLIFPPYKNMCYDYPWLNGKPLLLPIAWVVRIFKVLLFKRSRIKTHSKNIKSINKANVDAYQAELNYVGLDFNFEV